jgi:hypothetical protein
MKQYEKGPYKKLVEYTIRLRELGLSKAEAKDLVFIRDKRMPVIESHETTSQVFEKAWKSRRPVDFAKLRTKVRKTTFDSSTKAKIFYSLQSRWYDNFTIYPSLPLCKIIKIEQPSSKIPKLFNESVVDLTFCDPNDRPLFSIDLDEIGGGYSQGYAYMQQREPLDRGQKKAMDFKLRLAKAAKYPLIVVSDDETQAVDQEDPLTILDGIVGQFLTIAEAKKRVEELQPDISMAEIEETQHAVASEFNPIVKKTAGYRTAHLKDTDHSCSIKYLFDPPLPDDLVDSLDPAECDYESEIWQTAVRVGCRVALEPSDALDLAMEETVWLRNFGWYTGSFQEWSYEVSARTVARQVAEYLACKKACKVVLFGQS